MHILTAQYNAAELMTNIQECFNFHVQSMQNEASALKILIFLGLPHG